MVPGYRWTYPSLHDGFDTGRGVVDNLRQMDNRFMRTERLLGRDGLARLKAARVAVVGLGAVGSYAAEGLARAGVGHLRLVDFDTVRPSNINRQLYALDSTVGQAKVEVARCRILDINPACEVEALPVFVDAKTVDCVLSPPLDLVIDAIDSLSPKVELIAAAAGAGLRIVSCMGAAERTDPSKVRIAPLETTRECPLAKWVRKRLRQRGISHGVMCVYSEELPGNTWARPAAEGEEADAALDRGRKRRVLGSLSTLTGIFGLTAATEAIRLLTHAAGTTGPQDCHAGGRTP